jgi:hypothetical protein
VVGELWGTLDVVMRLPLHDVSPGGALVRSHVALPQDSIHKVTLRVDGREFTTDAKVRHVRSERGPSGETGFLIGVEFLGLHPVLFGQLAQLAITAAGPTAKA